MDICTTGPLPCVCLRGQGTCCSCLSMFVRHYVTPYPKAFCILALEVHCCTPLQQQEPAAVTFAAPVPVLRVQQYMRTRPPACFRFFRRFCCVFLTILLNFCTQQYSVQQNSSLRVSVCVGSTRNTSISTAAVYIRIRTSKYMILHSKYSLLALM